MHWEMQVQQPPVACLNNMHATEILTQSPHHSIKLLNKSQNRTVQMQILGTEKEGEEKQSLQSKDRGRKTIFRITVARLRNANLN